MISLSGAFRAYFTKCLQIVAYFEFQNQSRFDLISCREEKMTYLWNFCFHHSILVVFGLNFRLIRLLPPIYLFLFHFNFKVVFNFPSKAWFSLKQSIAEDLAVLIHFCQPRCLGEELASSQIYCQAILKSLFTELRSTVKFESDSHKVELLPLIPSFLEKFEYF